MVVQVETRGQLQEFGEVLRQRIWQILLPASLVFALGTAFAVIVPKRFLAKTQIEQRPVSVSVSGKEARNAAHQVKAPTRIKKVIEHLKHPEYLSLGAEEQREYIDETKDAIKVSTQSVSDQGNNFVTIEFLADDRAWAHLFLKQLRDDWIDDVLERDRNKVRDEVQKLLVEKRSLERAYEKDEAQLAELLKLHTLSPTQANASSALVREEDPEFKRLQEGRRELETVEKELLTAEERVKLAQKRYDDTPLHRTQQQLVEGVGHEAQILDLETQILDLREELERYHPPHSRYQAIQKDIGKLERRIDDLRGSSTQEQLKTTALLNPEKALRREDLERAKGDVSILTAKRTLLREMVGSAEKRVTELHDVYRRVRETSERVNRARTNLADVERKYHATVQQSAVLETPQANPFAITEEVNGPREPTEPNPWIIVAFSLIAGLALGIGLAVALEYSRNCFRSVYDISRVMVVPVLGSIDAIETVRQARTRRLVRGLVGGSAFLLIGSLLFVTWAWARSPDLLSSGVRNTIEELRSLMK